MKYKEAKTYIFNRIKTERNPDQFYHDLDHTLDVLESAMSIAKEEKLDEEKTILLRTACAYHDAGMLIDYENHEKAGCSIAREKLPNFGYHVEDIEDICKMIMATQLPQSAATLPEKIICDADLDYLGRDDFFMIAHRLRMEWIRLGVNDFKLEDWYQSQIKFLENHNYFTPTAKRKRDSGKLRNLEMIKEICPDKNS